MRAPRMFVLIERLFATASRRALRLSPLGVFSMGLMLTGTVSGITWFCTVALAHENEVEDSVQLVETDTRDSRVLTCAEPTPQAKAAEGGEARRDGDPLDAGASVRLGSSRYRVGGPILGMTFGANDQTIVAATERDLNVVEVATGNRVRTIGVGDRDEGEFLRLAVSSNRRSAISLNSETDREKKLTRASLTRWNLFTGERGTSVTLAVERERPTVVTISADAGLAVTGNRDSLLQIWDPTTGQELSRRQLGTGQEIQALAVSPDGDLVVASSRGNLFFWNWRGEGAPAAIPVGRHPRALAFSPDGTLLAEGANDRSDIVLRDVRTREAKRQLRDSAGNLMVVRSLAFSPDGRSLAATNKIVASGREIERRLHVWDVETGAVQHALATNSNRPGEVTWSRDGRRLAVGDRAFIQVWDTTTGRAINDGTAAHAGYVGAVRLSRDGRIAVTASDDNTLRVWDGTTGTLRHALRHERWVRSVALSPDARYVASSSLDDTVRLWETDSGREVHRLPGHGESGGERFLAFSSDGGTVVSWGDDAHLRVFDVQTGKTLSDRNLKPVAPAKELELDADTEEVDEGWGGPAAFSRDARRLATYDSVYDVATGDRIEKIDRHSDESISSVALSPDGRRLATAAFVANTFEGDKNIVCVTEIAFGKVLFRVNLPGSGHICLIAFSDDGRLLAVASLRSGTPLRILDARDGSVLRGFDGIRDEPVSLGFSGDSKRLAAGFADGNVLIWDLATGAK